MIARMLHDKALPRAAAVTAWLALGIALSGCAGGMSEVSDNMTLDNATLAFVDPARYDFYDCKQLEAERKNLASRGAELGQESRLDPGNNLPRKFFI